MENTATEQTQLNTHDLDELTCKACSDPCPMDYETSGDLPASCVLQEV